MRGSNPAVAVAGGQDAFPRAPLPAVFLVRLTANEPWLLERPMSNEDKPQRRLIVPGTYRITHNIVIEGELTLEQLQQLFIPANGATVRIQAQPAAVPEVSPEELERRRLLAERATHLAHAYREKLSDDGPTYLAISLEQWLKEGRTEVDLRSAMDETAAARGLKTTNERYQYMKEVLRLRRKERDGGAE